MTIENQAAGVSDWATSNGSIWAQRWRDTDAALADLAPRLLAVLTDHAPEGPFRAYDIGCGPGSTSIDLALACPRAEIIACDVSPDLAEIARQRTSDLRSIRVVEGDAERAAASEGPFDLSFSRHGVMFFPDPVRAFRSFRQAAQPGGAMVFSCFQSWERNSWASELASAAAGRKLPPPGREPSGFAFADPDYVREIFHASGWSEAHPRDVVFRYVASDGGNAVESALAFLTDLGPASRLIQSMPEQDRPAAVERMRKVIEGHFDGQAVVFPAAAWIWSARAVAP